jgi:hypothetical protein
MEHPNGEWSAKQQVGHLVEGEPERLGSGLVAYHGPVCTVGQPPEVDQPFLSDIAEADAKLFAWWLMRLWETSALRPCSAFTE